MPGFPLTVQHTWVQYQGAPNAARDYYHIEGAKVARLPGATWTKADPTSDYHDTGELLSLGTKFL